MTEQNRAIEKTLSKIISDEAAKEVSNLEGTALVEAFNLLDEQMAINDLHLEETTVKSLLDGLVDVISEILSTEKDTVYPVKIVDAYGTREKTESAFEHIESFASIALESFLYPLYDLLGYEVTHGESE